MEITGRDSTRHKSMRAIQARLVPTLHLVVLGACLALLILLSSCITPAAWYAPDPSIRAGLPTEVSFNKLNQDAGRGGNLFIRLWLKNGQPLLFAVDTGSPFSVLDKSLEPALGKRVATQELFYSYYGRRRHAGVFRMPGLYIGTNQLLTSRWVVTDDLTSMTHGLEVRGILGMDCLRQYCLQLDFMGHKIYFLDPDHAENEDLGKAFPLSFSSGLVKVSVQENFCGFKRSGSLIDTGDWSDGALETKLLQQALDEGKATWTNHVAWSTGPAERLLFVSQAAFGGETYSDLLLVPHARNSIGLRFLARHLVTFNFPKRTMYLQRRSEGPMMSAMETERKSSIHDVTTEEEGASGIPANSSQ